MKMRIEGRTSAGMKVWVKRRLLNGPIPLLATLLIAAPVWAGEEDDRWWPTQAFPKTMVRTANQQQFPEPRVALQMMVQSVAGLAAKAVNEGRGDELVWVNNGDGDLEKWYARLLARRPDLAIPGSYEPWDLVDRYARRGIIKGYILYRGDQSKGENNTGRLGMNYSVNVATSLAGLLDGIIVDEDLESMAKARGLKLLLDAREKTQPGCFQTYKNQFNRRMLCFQDPRIPHVRDLAIAQKVFTAYGNNDLPRLAVAWLEPLSPILGWNSGDEFENTDLSTGFGDIRTATDWRLNLPVLMAGTNDNAENMPQEGAATDGGVRGYSPVIWCVNGCQPASALSALRNWSGASA